MFTLPDDDFECCPDCNSVKEYDMWGNSYQGDGKCKECKGEGELDDSLNAQVADTLSAFLTGGLTDYEEAERTKECETCSGTRQCQTCDGTGKITRENEIEEGDDKENISQNKEKTDDENDDDTNHYDDDDDDYNYPSQSINNTKAAIPSTISSNTSATFSNEPTTEAPATGSNYIWLIILVIGLGTVWFMNRKDSNNTPNYTSYNNSNYQASTTNDDANKVSVNNGNSNELSLPNYPTTDEIKQKLIGHKAPDWTFNSVDEIQEININSERYDTALERLVQSLNLVLKDLSNNETYKLGVNIYHKLTESNEWEIENIYPSSDLENVNAINQQSNTNVNVEKVSDDFSILEPKEKMVLDLNLPRQANVKWTPLNGAEYYVMRVEFSTSKFDFNTLEFFAMENSTSGVYRTTNTSEIFYGMGMQVHRIKVSAHNQYGKLISETPWRLVRFKQ